MRHRQEVRLTSTSFQAQSRLPRFLTDYARSPCADSHPMRNGLRRWWNEEVSLPFRAAFASGAIVLGEAQTTTATGPTA